MADEPSRYTGPLLTAAMLIALVGWVVRRFTAQPALALLAQLVVLALWIEHRVSGGLPRPSGFRQVWNEVIDGADAAQRYASPVSVGHSEFHFLLLVSGIGILLAVDLLVCGMRRAALGGLPLLLAITISASVLLNPVDWVVFLLTGFGWLALIAIQETDRASSWGRGPAVRPRLTAVGGLAARIAVTCGLVAVVLSSALSSEGRTFGSFGQNGGNSSINVSNPMLDLRRNLVQGEDIPLVYVKTDDSAPSYLRTTVLDDFTGSSWQPTDRDFDSTSAIDGQLPPPPGLTSTAPVASHNWQIRVSESFGSQWLPLPYPTGKLDVDDKWRFDPETLDVIGVGNTNASGLTYNATALSPRIDSTALREAAAPPASLRARMTDLPNGLPAVFQRTAREVTKAAKNDFDRAVMLQDWFRTVGGFEYSLRPSSGTGASTLQKFITTDRVGYCEQFSAAMAVMARSLNIPARVAVGFLRADRDKDTFVFSAHDLHAWPELYFDGVGWIVFEPTPQDRTSAAPSYTTQALGQNPTDVPSASATATAQPTNQKPDVVPREQRGCRQPAGRRRQHLADREPGGAAADRHAAPAPGAARLDLAPALVHSALRGGGGGRRLVGGPGDRGRPRPGLVRPAHRAGQRPGRAARGGADVRGPAGDRRRGHVRRADPLRPGARAVGGHAGADREGRRDLARGGLPGGGPQAGPAGALVPALGDPGGHRPAADPGAEAASLSDGRVVVRSRSGRAGAASAPRAAA